MPEPPARSWLRWPRRILDAIDNAGLPIGTWPGDRWATRVNAAQAVAWALLATPLLVQTGHFTYDQAYFYELAVRTSEGFHLPGYGPFVSGARGSPLTPGGLLYCLLAVPFFVFRDPRWGHVWLLLLSLVGMLLLDRALRRLSLPPPARIGTLVLLNWSLAHARATETFWNGDVFTFVTPALLWVAARLRDDSRRGLAWSAVFGLLAALAVQTHLSGAMAVLLAGLVVLVSRRVFRWAQAGTAFCAFALAFLPFVVVDGHAGFVDWKLLRTGASPTPHLAMEALVRSAVSPVVQASYLESVADLIAPSGGWQALAICLSGCAAAFLVALGLASQFKMKHLTVLSLLGLPAFFFLTGRGYFEHYVLALVPFLCLLAGSGAGLLLGAGGGRRWAAVAYLAVYVLVGAVLLVTRGQRAGLDGWNPWRGMNVSWQIARSREALGRPPALSGPGDELAFVRWVVAKRLLGSELRFAVGGFSCAPEIRLSGLGPPVWEQTGARLIPLASNTVFVCDPKRASIQR